MASTGYNKCKAVMTDLHNAGHKVGDRIGLNTLNVRLIYIIGIDDRTVTKYLKTLVALGFLKPVETGFEILRFTDEKTDMQNVDKSLQEAPISVSEVI